MPPPLQVSNYKVISLVAPTPSLLNKRKAAPPLSPNDRVPPPRPATLRIMNAPYERFFIVFKKG